MVCTDLAPCFRKFAEGKAPRQDTAAVSTTDGVAESIRPKRGDGSQAASTFIIPIHAVLAKRRHPGSRPDAGVRPDRGGEDGA